MTGAVLTRGARAARGTGSWLPTWGLITTRHLELRRRRVLMVVAVLLTVGLPVLVLGIREIFHVADPKSYGPAGSPSVFQFLCNPMASFGFMVAATLGATAGTSDLTDGVFRQLVSTGRSRVALYLARIPAGLAILLPLVAAGFTVMCLVTSFAGSAQPSSVGVNGVSIPAQLSQAQLGSWIAQHPQQASDAFAGPVLRGQGGQTGQMGQTGLQPGAPRNLATSYAEYTSSENGQLNPSASAMTKIGLWIGLYIGTGFLVGLGLGSRMGQRTVPIIILIALEIIVTPILAAHAIPYFLDGQRLDVGVALDQLRPAGLAAGPGGGGGAGPGRVLFGGRGELGIPPMPTWAMITVIVGWIVGWSVIGAWRMATRDA
jgi:hypothetical protein